MPELPEVETIVRTLAPQIAGRRLDGVRVLLRKSLQDAGGLLPLLEGCTIERVSRRAKLPLLFLSPGASALSPKAHSRTKPPEQALILAFHLKMTGGLFVHPEGAPPLKHTRIIFDLKQGEASAGRLFFDDIRTFGFCRIMRPGELEAWPFWAALGPEPLEGSPDILAAHLGRAFHKRRGAVKAALLDQRVLAGIGNIYADESLFKAGIRPDARAGDIDQAPLLALAAAIQDILRLSIRECGSSIRNYKDANGHAGAFQNSFAVYGRKGQPCTRCGGPLQGARISGRGAVFCPRCQK